MPTHNFAFCEGLSLVTEVTASIQVGGQELIRDIADQWEALCRETGCAPFHYPEWVQIYLRAFEPGNELVLVTARAGNKLVAVLPLVRKKCWYAGVPLTKLTGAANVHSVRFEMLHTNDAEGEAALISIWTLLKAAKTWQILELPVFVQDGACGKLMALAEREGFRTLIFLGQDSPVLRMPRDDKGKLTWLAGTSRHFRHELRRWARLLEEQTGGTPTMVRFAEPHPEMMEKFYDMEAAGWKGRAGSAINCDPATRAFYDELAREAAARGYFSLHCLEACGTMAAATFGVMTDQCFFPLKLTHDEALHRGGPGLLLLNGVLQECAEKGISEVFFGGDKDRYKTSWTSETQPHFNGFIFSPDFRAQLAYSVRTRVVSPLAKYHRSLVERRAADARRRAGKSQRGGAARVKDSRKAISRN